MIPQEGVIVFLRSLALNRHSPRKSKTHNSPSQNRKQDPLEGKQSPEPKFPMHVPGREGKGNAVHPSAWLLGCRQSLSAEYHCSAVSGGNALLWSGALSLFTTHSCVSAGERDCTVACQPVLFDCLPNKPNGNSPLVKGWGG